MDVQSISVGCISLKEKKVNYFKNEVVEINRKVVLKKGKKCLKVFGLQIMFSR